MARSAEAERLRDLARLQRVVCDVPEARAAALGEALAASLAAFVAVYFIVFGAGIWYLFRLFGHAPGAHEEGPRGHEAVRTAGITPSPSVRRPGGADGRPDLAEAR